MATSFPYPTKGSGEISLKKIGGWKTAQGVFPLKEFFFMSAHQIPQLVVETHRQPSTPPPVCSFLGGVVLYSGKCGSVTCPGLVQA